MALKNLLVAYNGGEASNSALHLGALMSKKYDADLTGIVAHGASSVERNLPAWLSASLGPSIDALTREHLSTLEAKFRTFLAGKVADEKRHWIDVAADPDMTVSHYTRYFDVTLLGQYENLPVSDEYELHPDRIAFASGRPIMVAPKDFRPERINESAVIAWDGRRTSARAMFDAMHILETKDRVTILTVGSASDAGFPKGIDLPALLARNGIRAEHRCEPRRRGGIAETILKFCETADAGLLVMGAYEHSKLSEDLFGGVTSTILRNAQLPVFMSH